MRSRFGIFFVATTLVACGPHVISFDAPHGTSGAGGGPAQGWDAGHPRPIDDGGTSGGPPITKLDMVSDFEAGNAAFNKSFKWAGQWLTSADTSEAGKMVGRTEMLDPPRPNTNGSMSTEAYHVTENGQHLIWGSTWYAELSNQKAMDASTYD